MGPWVQSRFRRATARSHIAIGDFVTSVLMTDQSNYAVRSTQEGTRLISGYKSVIVRVAIRPDVRES
jgi:hypothetical protein